ncbi:tag-343 [Pristionchus pacificus]|uniref:RNA polymerase II-associated factor 1 homolog n=1 Tax=Pristionchus pacificus TaxID=54126 RepID=A0A2A6BEN8_PRIPA|nr:tag-343 [Pristionchus pacificus]|eukprot:PDM64349.1 tag-343 protein [Pristionchus pacificus]
MARNMIRKMIAPITVDGSLDRRNIFVGEAFGPPNVRVVFAGAAEDTKEREDRVFLLIGPSCATCIDAFANFFYGVQKEDDYRLHIANEKFDKTTPNKAIVTYVFNDSKMPFRPIVVDVKDDDASLLHKWLTENARLRIDVVCIVFNLLGRIETRHETAIKEMLSILPKRIRASASVLLTNSDGNPPPVALLRRFDLQESPVYKLNWTTLFTGKPDDSLKELLRSNYWNMSEKSLNDMISRIQTLHPHTFNGLPHEPPMFVIHLKADNASSSSSSSTSTSTFVERRTEHTTTTHHHYDLPPAMDPVQGRPEPSPPLVKTTIFQTTSKHIEDKIIDGPPAGIPKELLQQIEQRSSDDHSHGEKKVVVEKTITVHMMKKDDGEEDNIIERARARSMERLALEEKMRREEEARRREEEEKRRREEEEKLRMVKDQLDKERREREAIERKIREQEQAVIAKRARQEEERLLLIKVEEERREKLRIEQLAYEERSRNEIDDRARKLSEERKEMEAERRRLEEERKRLEGRRLEEIKKIEEERLRLEEQRRILTHEKNVNEAEKKRIEEEIREGERRRKEAEELRRREEEIREEELKRRKAEEEVRRRKEEEEFKRRKEEDDAKRKREDEEWRRKREIERKAREEEEKIRLETQRRREKEEEERKRKSLEEKNMTITYERTIERTRTEEVDERVIDMRPDHYLTRTYLNGDVPRHAAVIEEGHQSPIGDAPIVRFVFDESTRSYVHHLVEPHRHGSQREPSPNRSEQPLRILSRTETLIDDPFFDEDDDGGFSRDSPERVGHHRMSSPTRDERYQYVRGPTDLRSPGVAKTPADGLSSPEMVRRAETLHRTNQDVQRNSYPSGRESRKRERTQYENLPLDEAGNAYIIPDRMRHSKSPIIMRVKMSPKENSSPHQSAIAPPLPLVQRELEIPVQSTPAAEYSPPPLYQRTPPANASLPQRATPVAVHFASAVGSGAKPVGAGAPSDQYSTIRKPPPTPTPAQRSGKPSPIAPVLTPAPPTQSPSHAAPAYIRPPRQLGDDELMSPAGKAPVYGIDRPRELHPPPPVPIHKHPHQQQQPQRAPLARPEDGYGASRKPAGMSAEEERKFLLRLRPLDEYNRLPGEAEKGYRMKNRTTYYGDDSAVPREEVRFWTRTLVPIVIALALLAVIVYYLVALAPPFFRSRSEMSAQKREHMQELAGAFSP